MNHELLEQAISHCEEPTLTVVRTIDSVEGTVERIMRRGDMFWLFRYFQIEVPPAGISVECSVDLECVGESAFGLDPGRQRTILQIDHRSGQQLGVGDVVERQASSHEQVVVETRRRRRGVATVVQVLGQQSDVAVAERLVEGVFEATDESEIGRAHV